MLDEVLANASSIINILSDQILVRSPTAGFRMNIFIMRTPGDFRVILEGLMFGHASMDAF